MCRYHDPSEIVVRRILNRFPEICQRGYTITYCTLTSVLLVVPMPTAVDDIITDFFYHQMADWLNDGFVTQEIQKQIRFMPPSARLPRRHSRKNLSWKKEPNFVLGFGKLGIPRLVVEVGFSQSKKDLIDDAVEWLLRERRLMVVILVDINEDNRALTQTQNSDGFHSRVQSLQNRYGNGSEDSDGESESGQTLYDNIDRAIVDGDWVGPLRASLEVWSRNDEGVPTCREAVTVLPTPSGDPTVKITDLVPVESQSQFLAFDPSLEAKLNMETYKSALNMAVHDLARDRALGFLRPRATTDPDYASSQSSQEFF